MKTEIKDILIIILPIISAALSAWLTYLVIHTEAKRKFKEEKYQNLLCYLQGFVGPNASGEKKQEFFNELYKSRLYCSDKTVKLINDFMAFFMEHGGDKDNGTKGQELIGKIHIQMRKELLGKTKLKTEDFGYYHLIK
jgi:hypothetical protein